MLTFVEICLFVAGIVVLFTGKLHVSRTRVLTGRPARWLGLMAVLIVPFCWALGLLIGICVNVSGGNVQAEDLVAVLNVTEMIILAGCIIAFVVISRQLAPSESAKHEER